MWTFHCRYRESKDRQKGRCYLHPSISLLLQNPHRCNTSGMRADIGGIFCSSQAIGPSAQGLKPTAASSCLRTEQTMWLPFLTLPSPLSPDLEGVKTSLASWHSSHSSTWAFPIHLKWEHLWIPHVQEYDPLFLFCFSWWPSLLCKYFPYPVIKVFKHEPFRDCIWCWEWRWGWILLRAFSATLALQNCAHVEWPLCY